MHRSDVAIFLNMFRIYLFGEKCDEAWYIGEVRVLS